MGRGGDDSSTAASGSGRGYFRRPPPAIAKILGVVVKNRRLLVAAVATASFLVPIEFTDLSYNASMQSASTGSSSCPADLIEHLNCTEWTADAFDSMYIPHGTIMTRGANSTEAKFCESNAVPTAVLSAGARLATGVALVRCHRALLEVRFDPPRGRLTCGVPYGSADSRGNPLDPSRAFEGVDAILGTDVNFGNSIQHDLTGGLGAMAAMWNLIRDRPNLHLLGGSILNDFYMHLVGSEDRIHVISGKQESWWFRSLYLGPVPEQVTLRGTDQRTSELGEIVKRIQHGTVPSDPMLPCSVAQMSGFREWRQKYTRLLDHPPINNGTLMYLQRTQRRYFVFWDCSRDANNGICKKCQPVSEDGFLLRLAELGRLHGLVVEVFNQTNLRVDAAAMAKARVVIGPHGGAFANTLFLDPDLDPIIIETNLQQAVYESCQYSTGRCTEPPRPIFTHLAAALGHRYRAYQPHVWREYSTGDMRMSLEINDYLNFVDAAIIGKDAPSLQISAPEHPCASLMA